MWEAEGESSIGSPPPPLIAPATCRPVHVSGFRVVHSFCRTSCLSDPLLFVLSSHRGPGARNVDLEDLERTSRQGMPGRSKKFPAAGSGATNDGSVPLGEALQWAAGALDKIQVRKRLTSEKQEHKLFLN